MSKKEKSLPPDQQQMEQRVESIIHLAEKVTHDFNNMLSIITVFSELAAEELERSHPIYTMVDKVKKAAAKADKYADQLLSLYARKSLQLKVLDLAEAVTGMKKTLHRFLGQHIDLVLKTPSSPTPIKADILQIQQVLINLLLNVGEHISTPVVITVKNKDLDDGAVQQNKDDPRNSDILLCLDIPGAKIKDRFGLSYSYTVVSDHKGSFYTEESPDYGVRFRIGFPRFVAAKESGSLIDAGAANKGNERILLVEDDKEVRFLAHNILKRCGYDVIAAKDSEHAIILAEEDEEPIHLLLTDMMMPKMSGTEVFEKVQDLRPGIKVLFMSGYSKNRLSDLDLRGQEIHFLKKPFTLKEMSHKIREALDN